MKKLLLVLALGVFACGVNADTLWTQRGDSGYGFASQDFETSYDCYDCLTADDFEVPSPGWIIDSVEFDMLLYYGNSAPIHGMHIYFMPDRGDNLGDYWNPVAYEFNGAGTVYYGANLIVLDTPVTLGPGHYFFGAAPALDFATYSQSFFVQNDLGVWGQESHMINPNGCFGMGSDWFQPSAGYDSSFTLYGVIVPEPGVVSLAGLLLGAGALWLRRK